MCKNLRNFLSLIFELVLLKKFYDRTAAWKTKIKRIVLKNNNNEAINSSDNKIHSF